ncbi:hypothetical protein [uncultured Tateyamaria sp.]|uniref:hypothetical protein n=1 Tax=uncultured Tateyamaria sp. TaxID=455651 RepID=UPI0026124BA9|nr:hypothetical protein [uncultured Tateyamaria sp.]
MFAPVGYTDVRSIMATLIRGLDEENGLYFPSLEHIEVKYLSWLAWRYGEFDFIEQTVFETALIHGLFLCSPDGKAVKISVNPAALTQASAIDLYEDDESFFALKERLITGVPVSKGTQQDESTDPWAKHRTGGYRSVPMVYSRSDYIVRLTNHDEYLKRLDNSGFHVLANYPMLFGDVVENWRPFEGWSICVLDSCTKEFSIDAMRPKIHYTIFSAIWDNADEMFAHLFEPTERKPNVLGKVASETRALQLAEGLLTSESYRFFTLDRLRKDIVVDLGERAWRRVVDQLRPNFPFISKPGRKS